MAVEFTDCIVLDLPADMAAESGFKARVLIAGTEPLPYALQLAARFDAEPIEGIAVDSAGTGFSGYMADPPADGARLFVKLPGEPGEIDTGFTFHADGGDDPNA